MSVPMMFKKLFHTGYAVRDVDKAISSLGAKFGITDWKILRLPEDSPGRALAFAYAHDMMIELVDIKAGQVPIYNAWIPEDECAIRLHHLGYLVANEAEWQSVAQRFERLGVPLAIDAEMGDLLLYRYFDTTALLGHYSEFVLMKPDGEGFWDSVPRN
jgi:extradiol dioxygenase family protein